MEIQHLEERVENLEMKLSFQDDTIEQLNDAIIDQQKRLEDQKVQLTFLISRIKTMQVGSGLASEADETPPPHY
ncbi:SlyX family protein [Moritella yayanosii]|uniref:Protein SlyX homolog n=1 Tax=Moritella yayanosii TaxID=69539 RepID=A0A330LSM2_9GAMM|nr:SlyX family protein [Moritella yayanosii]SQD79964.1 Protein SlyX homolog [Moritella yayanosii]